MKQVDINENGSIEYSEFITASLSLNMLLSEQKIKEAFKTFDINEDGFISKDELRFTMGGLDIDD